MLAIEVTHLRFETIKRTASVALIIAALSAGVASASAQEAASPAGDTALFEPLIPEPDAEGYIHLEWDSLMPQNFSGEMFGEAHGKAVVHELLDKKVTIPGFMVPLDVDGTLVNKFLLVPYHGACVHVPPPPPNQLIYAKLDEPYALDEMWIPLEIFGTLKADYQETEVAAVGYRMEVDKIILFEYQ